MSAVLSQQYSQQELDKALDKAKVKLMGTPDTAFFVALAFSLKYEWSYRISTAATDGRNVLINPDFFMGLNTGEQVFLILHESLHVAYLHMARLMERNQRKWNCAADYVINLQLVQRGFQMPKCGLLDHQYADMSAEQVYDLLVDEELPNNPMEGDLLPSEGDAETLASDVQDILVRARIQSKMAGDKPGSIPGDIEIYLDGLLNPKLPWQKILIRYLRSFDKSDYSFKKPNRRFFPKYHLPSLTGEKLINLAIALDTSGSVTQHAFEVFVSEVSGILRMMKPEKITLVQFDTRVHTVNDVRDVQELKSTKFSGRGGTLVGPVMEWANENKPELLLIFSDGEFAMPEKPNTEVLWVINDDPNWKAPYGKVIHYSL